MQNNDAMPKHPDNEMSLITSTVAGYNTIYAKDQNGERPYSKRFGGKKINLMLEKALEAGLANIKERHVNILDYGAGLGTANYIYENFARTHKSREVHVAALDVQTEGLRGYEQYLIQSGFEKISGRELHYSAVEPQPESYLGPVYRKDNLTVSLVYTNPKHPKGEYQTLLQKCFGGRTHLTACLRGTLSHIPSRPERQKTLSMFNALMKGKGELIMSVPHDTPKMRGNYALGGSYEDAVHQGQEKLAEVKTSMGITEPGDVLLHWSYTGNSQDYVQLYYHLYTPKELKEDLAYAGFKCLHGVQASQTQKEIDLADPNNLDKRRADYLRCKSLKEADLQEGLYLMVQAQSEKLREIRSKHQNKLR